MAKGLRDLRRKMKAIKSTRQVTKAMELVAASKMRRAVQNAQRLRSYAQTAWHVLHRIAAIHPNAHPYLEERPTRRILAILIGSDRGLCGSLNAQMFRATQQYIRAAKALPGFERLDFVAVGRKGQQFLQRSQQTIIAAFPALSNHPTYKDILPLARLASESFLKGDYDQVSLLYPHFASALSQKPSAKVLLPYRAEQLQSMIADMLGVETEQEGPHIAEYLFEPSQESVLDVVLPQLTDMQVYQAILEAAASEHSARMVAMRSASDNASSILDDLTLTYNQTRQAGITAELAELSASKAALES